MEFDYKQYEPNEFEIIWASPECKVFSQLQNTWIGRKSKAINPNGEVVTKEHIDRDIDLYGKPMVDKIFEIDGKPSSIITRGIYFRKRVNRK